MDEPSPSAVLAWARLARAYTAAFTQIEQALKAAGLPGLDWYDVLLELDRAGPLRPAALQARLLLAQSNLSRLVDRMAAAGAVERRALENDRRGQIIAITRPGKALRRRMWPVYAQAIGSTIGDRLSEADAATLGDLLTRIGGPAS